MKNKVCEQMPMLSRREVDTQTTVVESKSSFIVYPQDPALSSEARRTFQQICRVH